MVSLLPNSVQRYIDYSELIPQSLARIMHLIVNLEGCGISTDFAAAV